MASPWLRLNADFHLAPKLIKAKAAGIWPHVLTALKRGDGFIDEDELDPEVFEALTCIPASVVAAQLDGLKRVGLLLLDGDRWTTPGWERYQPDPGASDRAKAWRESNEAKSKAKSPRTGPNSSHSSQRERTESNRSERTERERTPDGTGRDVIDHPPTPLTGGDAGEGEQEEQSEGYYSAQGGNRPASQSRPPEPRPGEEDLSPPERTALQKLEDAALACVPPGRRRGLFLSDQERRDLLGLGKKYGIAKVLEVLGGCGGADRPVAMAAKRLTNEPTLEQQRRMAVQPEPPRRREPRREDDPEAWDRGTRMLEEALAGWREEKSALAEHAARSGGGVG